MPLMPGAEAFRHEGGATGALLCHGFTGSPGSLRPWAQYLAEAGLAVSVPRLPGHGTTWQEMSRTRWEDWYAEADRGYEELRGQSNEIFVMGLSTGVCLALRMAEQRDRDEDQIKKRGRERNAFPGPVAVTHKRGVEDYERDEDRHPGRDAEETDDPLCADRRSPRTNCVNAKTSGPRR